jgi:hypothetical protein
MPAYLLDSQDQLFMHISLMYDVSNFVINHLDPLLKSKVLITFINSSMVLKLLTPSYYRSVRRAAAPIHASMDKRGWQEDFGCRFYDELETIHHLFFTCLAEKYM